MYDDYTATFRPDVDVSNTLLEDEADETSSKPTKGLEERDRQRPVSDRFMHTSFGQSIVIIYFCRKIKDF